MPPPVATEASRVGSLNPALVIRDILVEKYGEDKVDVKLFDAMATYCDQRVFIGDAPTMDPYTEESTMLPTIGRIVHVRLTAECARTIGGNAREDDLAPAMIVRVNGPDNVNVKILGDGPGDLWSTSLLQGEGLGQWRWPHGVTH